ncbi:MAG: ABC transporter permease [Promethearchaeati archaeon SRVP18_Atabeyarchaeia-1]
MKLRRISSLARKDLKTTRREPAALFMVFLFPVVLTLAFGSAFGAIGGAQSTTYQIGVNNLNAGAPHAEWANYLMGNLTATGILNIQPYTSNRTAQDDLIQGKISAYLIIPANFGESCSSFWSAPGNSSAWTNTTVPLYLDSGSMFATQAIPPIVQQALVKTIYGNQPSAPSGPVNIGVPSLVSAVKFTEFDYMAPGLFAFAAIFLIMIVAQSLVVERETKLLSRINTTPTTAGDVVVGKAISSMVSGLIQVALVFAMAFVIGYHPLGDATSLGFAFIIMAVFLLCCVGFGMIAAAISKSSGAATGVAFIFILPLMFLGTYVPVGGAARAVVPSSYVTDALTSLFLRGAPVSSPTILLDLAVVSIYSVALLLIGILLFKRTSK